MLGKMTENLHLFLFENYISLVSGTICLVIQVHKNGGCACFYLDGYNYFDIHQFHILAKW